ncbi:MAG: ADOP family duplicated permease [Longimicrobiales bacterium]
MSRLRRLFHLGQWGPAVDEGVTWEIEHHVEERIDELVAAGESEADARQEALRAFGDMGRLRRELLEIDGRSERRRTMIRVLDELAQDIRYGLRGVRLNPGIALGVILTLALGIGANAAMFSVVDALLMRPLPYEEPQELVELFMVTPPAEFGRPDIPYEVARGWQEGQDQPVLLHARATILYTGGLEPKTMAVQAVTPEFGDVFGVAPLLGRGLGPEDADPASPDVVLLDHGFWQTDLGAKRDVLGSAIVLNGIEHTVIGVMPKGFRFPTYSTTAAWVPLRSDGMVLGRSPRGGHIGAIMRAPAAERAVLNAQASTRGRALFRAAEPASDRTLRLEPLAEGRGGNADVKQAMLLLSGAVVLILLVAGVNMVNLLLARGSARANEMAVRMALGAARGRIVRQIATEAVLLALMGGAAAVLVALLVVRALQGIMPGSVTFFAPYAIAIEQRTLLFTFAMALASGLVFGLLPAFSATDWARSTDSSALTRYATRTRGKRRLRRGLVIIEVAFSVMLLVTASLLINSFVRLMRVDPGMRLENMAVLQFDVSTSTYPDDGARGAYLRRLEERIGAAPGVEAATLTGALPPNTGISVGLTLEVEGEPPKPTDDGMLLPHSSVGPDFFDVTGARLLAGRPFYATEDYSTGSVIIDEDLARHLWPDASPVGRRFRLDPEWDWLTVVGVMGDMRLLGPDERRGAYALLYPIGSYDSIGGQLAMAIRTRGDPRRVLSAIRTAVREVDPNQPIQELVPATTYYAQAVDLPKFLAVLMGILAALALALAAVGVHGVLAFGVAQRRHELGVRMVLGARAGELGRLGVGEGLILAAVGIVLGVVGALLSTRIVQGVLYGVGAVDPPTFAVAIVCVLIVVAAATLRPARRAARLDPIEVLRAQ